MKRFRVIALVCSMLFLHAYAHAQESNTAENKSLTQNQQNLSSEQRAPRHIYVKTNLLGLGALMANAAVEVDFAKHWSVQLPIYFSAWDYFVEGYKFRIAAIQPEVRFWPSRKSNDKFFIGAHGGFGHYNFAFGGEHRYQDKGCNTPALGGGLSVGVRFPLCKSGRWKMEFSVGAGAYSLNYDTYYNVPNGGLLATDKKTYIGLDQANLSLAYTFNLNNKRK